MKNADESNADVPDARAAWNAGADGFIHFVESGADYYRHLVHGPALLAACGAVQGLQALDMGCGQGYFSRLLASAGAAVTGIDLSERLLTRAQEWEAKERQGIRYRVLDAAQVRTAFEPESFDLVTACMSLQDMADVPATLCGVRHILRHGGRFVFSVPHPCTDPPVRQWQRDEQGRKLALCLDRYFDGGPAICDWNMSRLKYHWKTPFRRYTLTEWSQLLRDAGFLIQGLREPRPDERLRAEHPELDDCARMPFFLIFELVALSA